MTEKQARQQLELDGFDSVYVWNDAAGAFHENHAHPFFSSHIIIDGQLRVQADGETRLLRRGDRWDVPAQTVHSAEAGPVGCTYVIGERH